MARILITGGAGFIGSNLANRLIGEGHEVTIFDNLSRFGCEANLQWLRELHGSEAFHLNVGNLTDFVGVLQATEGMDRIYHLAGQVSVIRSVENPRQDFEDNALGTFNVLEGARLVGNKPIIIYSSTNKVYGSMEDVGITTEPTRYRFVHLSSGVPETWPLDLYSPYGCSKGAGEQYMHDYARIYGLRTVVIRQSCIYGDRQFGMEDQGWLAWFMIAALTGWPITIYGDGKQLRDVLFIDDLLEAYEAAVQHISLAAGQIYNIGGGPENTISVWAELGALVEDLFGHPIPVDCAEWRIGDQRVYVSDIRKADRELGWRPRISVRDGITRLFRWISDHQELFVMRKGSSSD
jgi:CDP-paratose 2-epimerase